MKTRRFDVVLEVACGTRGVARVAKRTRLLFRAENESATKKASQRFPTDKHKTIWRNGKRGRIRNTQRFHDIPTTNVSKTAKRAVPSLQQPAQSRHMNPLVKPLIKTYTITSKRGTNSQYAKVWRKTHHTMWKNCVNMRLQPPIAAAVEAMWTAFQYLRVCH